MLSFLVRFSHVNYKEPKKFIYLLKLMCNFIMKLLRINSNVKLALSDSNHTEPKAFHSILTTFSKKKCYMCIVILNRTKNRLNLLSTLIITVLNDSVVT